MTVSCIIPNCTAPSYGLKRCRRHYYQLYQRERRQKQEFLKTISPTELLQHVGYGGPSYE